MRTYECSHKWISFHIDLREASHEFWLYLGEAASKCEHLSQVLLRPATDRQLHRLYLAKGVAATTAIEGNTLSEAEVLQAVEGKLKVSPSKEYQEQEVNNIIDACNTIGEQVAERTLPPLNTSLICGYNSLVRAKLPEMEDVAPPGKIRGHSVVVGNMYHGAPAEDCLYLLERLCEWLNGQDFFAIKGNETVRAILKAVAAHIYLAWIHPFGDGNGRTARLLEFHILLSAGIPSPAAHLLSNHYNQTRSEYYRQLEYARKPGVGILPFLRYAIGGFVDGLQEQLKYVWAQQWDVVWSDYVNDLFQDKNSVSDTRQRHLALDLGEKAEWVQVSKIPETTTRLAKAYAKKTSKTLHRDLNALKKMGLIVQEGRKVRAQREVLQTFLPLHREPDRA